MKIWVDADACPVVIKDILCRAAERTKLSIVFIANQFIRLPPSKYLHFKQVSKGFDVADNEIIQQMNANDLVITGDIPLAAEVIEKGGLALNHRGELYTVENIRERLNMRDFMASLRDSGIQTQGQSPFNNADKQNFANQLDKMVVKMLKKSH